MLLSYSIKYKKLKTVLKGSKIFKNLVILTSGTIVAQIVGILASPILSRLYSLTDFGILGSIMAISSIVLTISSLKYDMAIVLEKDNKKANILQSLSIYILIIVSISFGGLIIVTQIVFPSLFENNLKFEYLVWIIPIVLFSGLLNIFFSRLNRDENYKQLAGAQIVRRTGIVVLQILFGVLSAKIIGLVFGNLLGILLSIGFVLYTSKYSFPFKKRYSYEEIREIAVKYRKFPIYTAPQTLLNTIFIQSPVLILGYFFSIKIVGAYFFTLKIVQLPVGFLGQSVRRVFYKEASNLYADSKSIDVLYSKTIIGLISVIILPMVFFIILGPKIFEIVFGEEWKLAGEFARWMILWYSAIFVMAPSRALFLVFGKQKLLLIIDTILGIVRVSALVIASLYFSPIMAVAVFSIISFIVYLGIIFGWKIYLIKRSLLYK